MAPLNFHGRIKNRLSKKNVDLLENNLTKFLFSPEAFKQEDFLNKIKNFQEVALEIGFGYGDFTYKIAKNNPHILYLGVEVFNNGIASLVTKLEERPLDNLYIYNNSIYNLLPFFPDNLLSYIYVLFPDPWPKKRHHKRRMISKENLLTFSRILKNGGYLRFVTDVDSYKKWAVELLEQNNCFIISKDTKNNIHEKPSDHITTKYEKKALEKEHKIFYISAFNNK